jgi:DNA-binding CsgD family transcriptional regulator
VIVPRTLTLATIPCSVKVSPLLLDGMSEKEIAVHLDISAHTVHVYAKALHRAFGVRSRSELLSRFVVRPTHIPR